MKNDRIEKEIIDWLITSRQEGVSVLEMSRAMGWLAGTVYDVLREAGTIEPIPPRRYYGNECDGIHPRFLNAMNQVQLSPRRWARSWGYELSEVAEYTSESADMSDPDVKALHKALSRDFNREYLALYKRVPAAPVKFPENPCKTFIATRDGKSRVFTAHVLELEEYEDHPIAKGATPALAVAELEKKVTRFLQQYRLNYAIHHVRGLKS